MEEVHKRKVEAKMTRILPIPDVVVKTIWSAEEVRVEAEKWCKPFCCRMAWCMELRKRSEQDQYECSLAQQDLNQCVATVSSQMQEIQKAKNKISNA